MTVSTWLLFLFTELFLCLTPGPAVLFVFSHGLRYGGRHSLWANLGILTGNAFYFVISATGLGMLVTASHTAFTVVKYAGAAYLIYLGVRMIFGRGDAFRAEAAPPIAGTTVLRRAFVLQASNPKALVFFTALLPQFVTPGQSIPAQMLILGITSIAVEFFVLAMYGYGAERIAAWSKDARIALALNRGAGAFLVACGVTLLDFAAPASR